MKISKGELMWLACSCAITIAEHFYSHNNNLDAAINILEGHVNTQAIINELSAKESDYVMDKAKDFFTMRVVHLVDKMRSS